jgi:hypothetical protein
VQEILTGIPSPTRLNSSGTVKRVKSGMSMRFSVREN